MKKERIIYWVFTGLLCLMMLMGAGTYVFDNENVANEFIKLGFPIYLIYLMATAKTLGVVAILTNKSKTLKEWAYAGFFFNFLLAFSAHVNAGDGEYLGALIAMVLLMGSYFYHCKLYKGQTPN